MAVRLSEDAPPVLVFPVEQRCESGVNEWVEIAADGADPHDLDSPAPVVTVTAAGTASSASHGDHAADGADSDTTAPNTAQAAAPIGTILGGGGLLAAIAALIVAVLAYRRSTRHS